MSGRQYERAAFERAIGMLKWAAKEEFDYERYVSALKFNQTIWTLIQSGLSEGEVELSSRLKTNILNLSLFVDAHTLKALANPRPEFLAPLIDIDLNITGGLFPSPAQAA